MKPMLAVEAPKEIKFPVFASVKLDGIRCLMANNFALSRTLKPLPNRYIQDKLFDARLQGLDGEITVGDANHPNVMQNTTSGVMSRDGEPNFTYWVFDFWTDVNMTYGQRWDLMQRAFKDGVFRDFPHIKLLQQTLIRNEEELRAFERVALEQGFEGVIIRDPKGVYKYGRSTAKEGYMLKVKRFVDSEAVVTSANELMKNNNIATIDELGHTKRSSHAENKIPMGTLGSLSAKDIKNNMLVDIGTGFTAAQRDLLWSMHLCGELIGKTVKYKYFEIGVKEAPRFPVFIGFRDPIDIGEVPNE